MKFSFEPGDGSFEITLDEKEHLPEQWNVKGVTVWMYCGKERGYECVKGMQDILPKGSPIVAGVAK